MWYVLFAILALGVLYLAGIIVWGVGHRMYVLTGKKRWGFLSSAVTAFLFYVLFDWIVDIPPFPF